VQAQTLTIVAGGVTRWRQIGLLWDRLS